MPIPKSLHLIWVGTKPLPDKYVANIKKWFTNNPDFTINLWVDGRNNAEIIEQYRTLAKFFPDELASGRFRIRDAHAENMIDPCARYEINRLKPNYGAASDLIRYKILQAEGGGYLDCDVSAPATPLSEAQDIWSTTNPHTLAAIPYGGHAVINDMLFCAPGNRILKALQEEAYNRYRFEPSDTDDATWAPLQQLHARLHTERSQFFIYNATLMRTGPPGLYTAMKRNGFEADLVSLEAVEAQFRVPIADTSSDATWLAMGPKPFDNLDDALKSALSEVDFALSSSGPKILKLEDIAINLLASLELTTHTKDEIITKFLEKVAERDLSQVKACQLSFFDERITEFYKTHGLMALTGIFPSDKFDTEEVKQLLSLCHTAIESDASLEDEQPAATLKFIQHTLTEYKSYIDSFTPGNAEGITLEGMQATLKSLINRIAREGRALTVLSSVELVEKGLSIQDEFNSLKKNVLHLVHKGSRMTSPTFSNNASRTQFRLAQRNIDAQKDPFSLYVILNLLGEQEPIDATLKANIETAKIHMDTLLPTLKTYHGLYKKAATLADTCETLNAAAEITPIGPR